MRHALAALAVIALAITLAVWAPHAEAKKDPEAARIAKLEKDAVKSAKKIVKATVKRIRSLAKAKTKELKVLVKAVKKGKNLEELSGVPNSPRNRAADSTLEQVNGVWGRGCDVFGEYCAESLGFVEDGYAACASHSSIQAFSNVSRTDFLPGTGLLTDLVHGGCSAGLQSSTRPVVKQFLKLGRECDKRGLETTFINCFPPKLGFPTFRVGDDGLFETPHIAYTAASNFECRMGLTRTESSFASTRGGSATIYSRDGAAVTGWPTRQDSGTPLIYYRYADASLNTGSYRAGYSHAGGSEVQNRGLITAPLSFPGQVIPENERDLNATLSRTAFFEALVDDAVGFKEGDSCEGSDPSTPSCTVEAVVDQCVRRCGFVEDGANKLAQFNDALFPCGEGPNGFTVCATIPAADPGGRLVVVGIAYGAEIPLDDNVNSYQYGFVFDQDGNTGNDYVPIPRFVNDFYRDSDKWYSLEYTPATGWELKVTDARNNNFTPVASAARAIINGNSIVLAVPAAEFAVASPAFRTTSFRHTGDFGLNPPHDYSADYDPRPGEPLRPFTDE